MDTIYLCSICVVLESGNGVSPDMSGQLGAVVYCMSQVSGIACLALTVFVGLFVWL